MNQRNITRTSAHRSVQPRLGKEDEYGVMADGAGCCARSSRVRGGGPRVLSGYLLILVVAMLLSSSRDAEAHPEKVWLRYEVESACPGSMEFARAIAARTLRFQLAEGAGQNAPSIEVSIFADGGTYAGKMRIARPNTPPLVRTITASACTEVVEALALIAVLAFDPRAMLESTERPDVSASTSTRVPPPRWYAGAQLHWRGGLAPGIRPEPSVFLELASSSSSVWSPSLRLNFLRVTSGTVNADHARATWTLLGGRAEGCPLRAPLHAHVDAQACALVELGSMDGQGQVEQPLHARRGWASAGAGTRLRWDLHNTLFVEGHGGVVRSLTMYRMVLFDPERELYQIPSWAGYFGLGLAARFL